MQRLDVLCPAETVAKLPVELQLQLFQHYVSLYNCRSSDQSAEEVATYEEGVIKYGYAIRALGDRISQRARVSAMEDLLTPLSRKNPAEAIALFDEVTRVRQAYGFAPPLYDGFEIVRLLIRGERDVRDLAKARTIMAAYEKDISEDDIPMVYVLRMEEFAAPEGFNEEALLGVTERLAEFASKNPYCYLGVPDKKTFFVGFLQNLVKQEKAATAFKVLNVLIASLNDTTPESWRREIIELADQFLRNNLGVGPAEERQRVLGFIEGSLMLLPVEKRFAAIKERLDYFVATEQWGEAQALYEKLLDENVIQHIPEWVALGYAAIDFYTNYAPVYNVPRAEELDACLKRVLENLEARGEMDVS